MSAKRSVEASERLLRSLVPPEDWVGDDVFVVREAPITAGVHVGYPGYTWVIDIRSHASVYQVVRDKPAVQEVADMNVCNCADCRATRERRSQSRFGEYADRVRTRGMLLSGHHHYADLESREALLARAISLVLMFQTKPGQVNGMAC